MLKVVNQQVISDMDDDDDNEGLLEPALAVDDKADDAFDLNVPPTTGNEYLRRVREEARSCPKVVVASMDTSVYRHKQTVKVQPKDTMSAPRGFSPTSAWVKMQIADFVSLRQKVAHFKALLAKKKVSLPNVKLPQHNDADSWCRLCFGRLQLKTRPEPGAEGAMGESSLQNDGSGTPPLLSIVARMDQPTVIKVLEYHVNWLEATGFTHRQKSPEEETLLELNLMICLVAHYFDQGDLADKT